MRGLALLALLALAALPVAAQDTAQPIPPEHMQRMQGHGYEQKRQTEQPYRDAEQFPHLSSRPPVPVPLPPLTPPTVRCVPRNSTDPDNSATSPPSCP